MDTWSWVADMVLLRGRLLQLTERLLSLIWSGPVTCLFMVTDRKEGAAQCAASTSAVQLSAESLWPPHSWSLHYFAVIKPVKMSQQSSKTPALRPD